MRIAFTKANDNTLRGCTLAGIQTAELKEIERSEHRIGLHRSASGEYFSYSRESRSRLNFWLVDNRKHLEPCGPFPGVWARTARGLRNAGYRSGGTVRADIQRGALHPYILIFDYGRKADLEVRAWLGLKGWGESWGNPPRGVNRKGFRKCISVFGF